MPPDRLVVLTHCIRAAFLEGNSAEAEFLLAERSRAVQRMVESAQALSWEEREAIREADDLLIATLNERKGQISEKLRSVKVSQRVRQAYGRF